jgi:Protein of unknown function (DUF1523).
MNRFEERQQEIRKRRKALKIKKVLVLVAFISIFVGLELVTHLNRNTYTVTVTEKQIKMYNDEDKYLVYTKADNGVVYVFENTDSMFEHKYNSSDIYGQITQGNKYRIETYGKRIPFWSSYENILSVSEVK